MERKNKATKKQKAAAKAQKNDETIVISDDADGVDPGEDVVPSVEATSGTTAGPSNPPPKGKKPSKVENPELAAGIENAFKNERAV